MVISSSQQRLVDAMLWRIPICKYSSKFKQKKVSTLAIDWCFVTFLLNSETEYSNSTDEIEKRTEQNLHQFNVNRYNFEMKERKRLRDDVAQLRKWLETSCKLT